MFNELVNCIAYTASYTAYLAWVERHNAGQALTRDQMGYLWRRDGKVPATIPVMWTR